METPTVYPPISAAHLILKHPNSQNKKFHSITKETKQNIPKSTKPRKNHQIFSKAHVPINPIPTLKQLN